MWIADKWEDYELLDCGGGEKLERWGDVTLIRPCLLYTSPSPRDRG